MAPARLTSTLLARKGQARPTGSFGMPAIGLARPLPTSTALTRPAMPLHGPTAVQAPELQTSAPSAGPGGPGGDDRVRLTVRIDRTLHTRLRVLAARDRRTNGDVVGCALSAYLEALGAGCPCLGGTEPED